MHTYLALLLVQESFFRGGVIDPNKNPQNFRTYEDWKTIKKEWVPYIWAFKQGAAYKLIKDHELGTKAASDAELAQAEAKIEQHKKENTWPL